MKKEFLIFELSFLVRPDLYVLAIDQGLEIMQLLFGEHSDGCGAVDAHVQLYAQITAHTMDEAPVPGIPGYDMIGLAHNPWLSIIRRMPHEVATSSSSLQPLESSHPGIM